MNRPRPPAPPHAAHASPSGAEPDSQHALQDALRAVLRPLAELALAQGLPCAAVEELTRQAFIDAARKPLVEAGLPEHRLVSRISTATGIHRREVTRLTTQADEHGSAKAEPASLASEVFAAWVGHRKLRQPDGRPKPLKRQGRAPSFEALTRGITLDVHPRSVLEELCRLGLARLDAETDTVHLLRATFVPGGDQPQLLRFLADNVGDHLRGAVHNVQPGRQREHFDQAVFCDELSAASIDKLRAFTEQQWQRILQDAMPLLEACHAADVKANASLPPAERTNHHRVRIGLYDFDERMTPQHLSQPTRTKRKTQP